MAKGKIRAKQAQFVQEYLTDFNATQAALRAGYSPKTAYSIGQRLLKKVEIQAELARARQEAAVKTGVTPEKVLAEAGRLGLSNMKRLAKWGPGGVRFLDSDELAEEDAVCVQEVSETTTKEGGTIRIKLHSKNDALDKLFKFFGLYNADNSNKSENKFVIIGTAGQSLEETIKEVGSVRIKSE